MCYTDSIKEPVSDMFSYAYRLFVFIQNEKKGEAMETMFGFRAVRHPLTAAQYHHLMEMVYDHSKGDWEDAARKLVTDKPQYVCVPKKDSDGYAVRFLY